MIELKAKQLDGYKTKPLIRYLYGRQFNLLYSISDPNKRNQIEPLLKYITNDCYHKRVDNFKVKNDGDLIHIGNLEFKVIHTPGHTAGSTSLYLAEHKLLFSGDTLFRGAWGRTDVPTASFEAIIASITNKLIILPDNTIVYPGHGKSTMIKEEKPIYLDLKPRLDY